MFGHPQYVWMPPFICMHPLYVWMPLCLDTLLYVWMPPYVWVLPCLFGHPYVWMPPEYVDTPHMFGRCLDAHCTYTTQIKHALSD